MVADVSTISETRMVKVRELLTDVDIGDTELRYLAGSLAGRQTNQSIADYVRQLKHKPKLTILPGGKS